MVFALSLSKRDLSQNNAVIYQGGLRSTDFPNLQACRTTMFAFLREWHKGEGYTEEQLDLDSKVIAAFFRCHRGDTLEYRTKDKPNIVYRIIKSGDKAAMDDPSSDVVNVALQTTKKVSKLVTTGSGSNSKRHEQIYTYDTANTEINPMTKTPRQDPMLAAFFNSPNIVSIYEEYKQMGLARKLSIAPADAMNYGGPQK